MAGRGPRHYPHESPHSIDGLPIKDGSWHESPPSPRSGPLLTHQPRLDLEAPPSLMGSLVRSPPPQQMEQKLVAQQAEMQRLITENQHLAATHVALRQELAAAQEEIMHLQQSRSTDNTEREQRVNVTQVALRQELADSKQDVGKLQETMVAMNAERDQLLRASMEKSAHLEIKLKGIESLKADFDKVRFDREELLARVDYLSTEVRKIPVKDQEIATLRREVDELRHRHQQARMDFEMQKKLNFEHLEHQQALKNNVFAMTREIERLRIDLINAERRHQAYLAVSNGGSILDSNFQRMVPSAAHYESNFGPSQDVLKGSSSENKSVVDISSYGIGADASGSRLPRAAPINADLSGEWKAVDGNAVHQKQTQKAPGAATPETNSELAPSQHQQKKPTLQQSQSVQQSVSPAPALTAALSQSGSPGVSLLVFGLSEGISDRDLASLFHPYGAILHAKVMVDTKTGSPQIIGIVTMENAQAAEAAAVAVTGMFILGKRVKVEMQQGTPHQQYLMQHGMMQGGVGPIRAHRFGGSSGHWPY